MHHRHTSLTPDVLSDDAYTAGSALHAVCPVTGEAWKAPTSPRQCLHSRGLTWTTLIARLGRHARHCPPAHRGKGDPLHEGFPQCSRALLLELDDASHRGVMSKSTIPTQTTFPDSAHAVYDTMMAPNTLNNTHCTVFIYLDRWGAHAPTHKRQHRQPISRYPRDRLGVHPVVSHHTPTTGPQSPTQTQLLTTGMSKTSCSPPHSRVTVHSVMPAWAVPDCGSRSSILHHFGTHQQHTDLTTLVVYDVTPNVHKDKSRPSTDKPAPVHSDPAAVCAHPSVTSADRSTHKQVYVKQKTTTAQTQTDPV